MKNTKGGFTLIELLVVVLIIGILSSIALPQYTKAVEKARATEAMTWLNDYVTAQTVYHLSRGAFATSFDELDIGMPADAVSKNFTIPAAAGGGTISLTRKNSPSMQYDLKVTMEHATNDDKITVKRECIPTGTGNKICQTITNGLACAAGAKDTSWCVAS